jgi:HPr kinase/phosphorylase
MEVKNKISLSSLIKEFRFETIYLPCDADEIFVTAPEVDRPGLALAGFFDIFEESRIQLIGNAELAYLSNMNECDRDSHIRELVARKPVVIMMTSGNPVPSELVKYCKEYAVPLLSTEETTSATMAALFASLNVHLAPCITRHGVLVEVYGEGILILGDSGVGKSETAIELVKRGHRLIADDAVEIKRVSKRALVGQAPEILRHYVELRGIGIIDVKRLYGISAVKDTKKLDLVINLESWVQGKMYDRLGLDEQTINILGIDLPSLTIPVRPGRNLAIILEIAAMNNRQKKMGYNTAEEFNKRLMAMMGIEE